MDVFETEEVLNVLRGMRKRRNGPLLLKEVFKSVIGRGICESSKSVSDCLRKLQTAGKIRTLNRGVDIELLEDVKVEYVQSSLVHGKR
ncbi:MAG: hypothetical protein ABIA12_01680 [Candidatus Aenigmatarchaeota archaeon]